MLIYVKANISHKSSTYYPINLQRVSSFFLVARVSDLETDK